MSESSTRTTVLAALAGNFLIAVTKFVAAWWTGSSAMLSEAFHSLVDTSNQILLLYGQNRADKPADRTHPLGYGRELYFWSFVVAVLIFGLGAGLALYQGVQHVLRPVAGTNLAVNYIVLGISFVFEGTSWTIALRNFNRTKGDASFWDAIRRSKDPPAFIVLLEDSAALIGIAIAAAGIAAAEHFGLPALDGAASIGIGALLAVTAFILARESKSLLIGEAASPEVERAVRNIAQNDPDVKEVTSIWTIHLAPDEIIATLGLDFADPLRTPQIEAAIERIQKQIKLENPLIVATLIRPPTV